jgi:ADP-ribose pyrophosphatase YjhB (NUDIX family)
VGAPLNPINPALADVRFCPRCGREAHVDYPRRLTCPHCGYDAFFNPAPVVSVVLEAADGGVVLARRGMEPGKGRWSTPGGYVDLGESVEDAAHREIREELDVEIELLRLVGIYSKPEDRVILIVFAARALGTPTPSREAPEVRVFARADIPWDELAFWNDEHALRDHLRTAPDPPSR